MADLFVYGSLLNDEVVQAVTGRVFASQDATVQDHFVSSLADRAAPGLIELEGSTATGRILLDVDEAAVQVITNWESTDYRSVQVTAVNTAGKEVICQTFLWNGEALGAAWSNDTFRAESLAWYVECDIPVFLSADGGT